MPASPAQAEHLAAGVVAHYQDAEAALIARIAKNLARGLDAPTWAADKLAQIEAYRRQAEALLRDLETKAARGVSSAITDAYDRGGLSAVADIAKLNLPLDATGPYHAERVATLARSKTDKELQKELQRYSSRVGLTSGDRQVKAAVEREITWRAAGGAGNVVEPLAGLRAVEALTQETLGNVLATHNGILRSVMDTYRSVIAESSSGVLLGDQTRRQAAQAALNRFAQKGIVGFVDAAGRGWRLENYTEVALRTACGRAAVQGHVDRLQANGLDLVIVSDAPKECDRCRPFEGKVYSLSGTDPKYPSLDSARAGGLFHCNCRHSTSLYQPGITRPMHDTEDPQGYADTTHLRYLERQTRAAKRVELAAMDEPARKAAHAKVMWRQSQIREHVATTTAKRSPVRERLGAL